MTTEGIEEQEFGTPVPRKYSAVVNYTNLSLNTTVLVNTIYGLGGDRIKISAVKPLAGNLNQL